MHPWSKQFEGMEWKKYRWGCNSSSYLLKVKCNTIISKIVKTIISLRLEMRSGYNWFHYKIFLNKEI